MKNKNLNRYGDTSFRLKNQINFYSNLIVDINNYLTDNKVNKELIFLHLIKEEVINYSTDKKIDNDSRASMLFKQIIKFGLLKKNSNKEIVTTDLYNTVFNLLQKSSSNDYKNVLNLPSLIFIIFLLLSNNKESKIFKIFINYLYEKYKNENDLAVSKQEISLFSIVENIDDFKNYKSKSYLETISALFNNFPSENELKDILINHSIDELKNNFYNLLESKNIPKFSKPTKELELILCFLKDYISSNFSDSIIDKYENCKNLKKIITNINKDFKLGYKNNEDLIKKEKLNLIYLFYKYKKYKLIYCDYRDINFRWFNGINLIKSANEEFFVDVKVLKICKHILDNFSTLEDIEKIIESVNKNFVETEIIKKTLPYSYEVIYKALKFFTNEEINYTKLRKLLKLTNVANSTIYEYLINISIAIIFDYSVEEFRNYTNTILDSDLKPVIHAPGRRSDGILYDKHNNLYFTVEATILKNSELYKEKESIHNHVIDYFDSKKITNEYSVLFVHNNEPEEKSIVHFMSERGQFPYKDPTKKIKVLMLSTDSILVILENKNKNFFKSALNKIPFKIEDNTHEELSKMLKEYNALINELKS